MNKYLEALEAKREDAQKEIKRLCNLSVGEICIGDITALRNQIATYTECIELYKSMQSKNEELLSILKLCAEVRHNELYIYLSNRTDGDIGNGIKENEAFDKVKRWLENE